MNYKQIIVDVFTEGKEHRTAYLSNFKRKAQIAMRDNFVEFDDFFNDCLHSIKIYKNEIEKQYNKRLKENDWVLNSINSGNGIKIDGELITDTNNKKLKESLDYYMNDKKYVEERGFKSNRDYSCQVSTTGEISKDIFEIKHKFYYADLELLEGAAIKAKEELQHIFDDEKPITLKAIEDKQKDEKGYIPTKEKFQAHKDSELPTINPEIIDPYWVWETYHNIAFKCSIEAFYAWLVYGKEHKEKIEWIFEVRKGIPSKAQLKMFINAVTGDEENTKETFFDRVFGIEVIKSDWKETSNLDCDFYALSEKIELQKSTKK